jgi:cation:H+ antiporter
MLGDAILVVIGLAALTVAADHLVRGAARLAVNLRIPAVVVGAVVIGLGTSAPELLVSVLAALEGSLPIAVGNIVGSNMANVTLVLGVAALIAPIPVNVPTLRREAPIAAGAVVLFAIVIQNGITRVEGVILLVTLAAVAVVLFRPRAADAVSDQLSEFVDTRRRYPMRTEATRTAIGLIGTIAGSQALVSGARGIAEGFGLAEGFVGVSLVAVGTSLPELVSSIQAARARQHQLIVGNLLGSNIINSLLVGGVVAVVGPGPIDEPTLVGLAAWIMAGVAAAGSLLMGTGRQVARWEGALLLAVFVITMPLVAG